MAHACARFATHRVARIMQATPAGPCVNSCVWTLDVGVGAAGAGSWLLVRISIAVEAQTSRVSIQVEGICIKAAEHHLLFTSTVREERINSGAAP
jgi:hypothetical protein